MVGVVGFEPTQPKQQIYSLPRLSNFGAPPHGHITAKMLFKPQCIFNHSKNRIKRADRGIRTPDPLITNQLLWPTELCRRLCTLDYSKS